MQSTVSEYRHSTYDAPRRKSYAGTLDGGGGGETDGRFGTRFLSQGFMVCPNRRDPLHAREGSLPAALTTGSEGVLPFVGLFATGC